MNITVYRWHAKNCKHRGDRYSKKCDCRCWFQYQHHGKQVQVSSKTRDWQEANRRARLLEKELETEGKAIPADVPPPVAAPVSMTVKEAISHYMAYRNDPTQIWKPVSNKKHKRMTDLLSDFCLGKGITHLHQLTPLLLTEWRQTWPFDPNTNSPRIHDAVARCFFTWLTDMDLIAKNPYRQLRKFAQYESQTHPFTNEEMQQILMAVESIPDWDDERRFWVRTLILVQRYSGLAAEDALTLQRSALHDDNSLTTYRIKTTKKSGKTGEEVVVALPAEVAEMLRMIPNSNPKYFFWNGLANPSIKYQYFRYLKKVFKAAGIEQPPTGLPLSHRLRDTFANAFHMADGKTGDLAMLMGHASQSTTEKHYSAWNDERRERLRKISEENLAKQVPLYLPTPARVH